MAGSARRAEAAERARDGGGAEQSSGEQNPGGAEREGGREGVGEIHNLGAKLSDGSGTAANTRNGGAAAGSELELANGDG
jgi:hypothetical protein